MNRTVWLWGLCGFATTSLLGTLLHFLYDLFGEAVWIAPFSGVNESTWEHMKLMFWPMLAFAVVESFFFSKYDNFWCVKLKGTLIGLIMIPILFYTYNGVIGKSPDWINITIFFISSAVAYIYETKALGNKDSHCKSPQIAIAILSIIAVFFVIFTFSTPPIDIFKDPLTGELGL